jgi:hypothetical protein
MGNCFGKLCNRESGHLTSILQLGRPHETSAEDSQTEFFSRQAGWGTLVPSAQPFIQPKSCQQTPRSAEQAFQSSVGDTDLQKAFGQISQQREMLQFTATGSQPERRRVKGQTKGLKVMPTPLFIPLRQRSRTFSYIQNGKFYGVTLFYSRTSISGKA